MNTKIQPSATARPQKVIASIRDLHYTLPRLLVVSTILMFSGRMFSLVCDDLVPGLKPILLNSAGATSTQIGLIIGTIPQIFGFFLVPLISTASDKTRSRLGRRLPYMLWSAPFLVVFLQLIAWHKEIAAGLLRLFPVLSGFPTGFLTLALFILAFQVAFIFPASVATYLTVDVIPKEYLGRFLALSMAIGTAMRAAFNYFLLRLAVDHTKLSLALFGAVFAVSYILLYWQVDEGTYPPVEDKIDRGGAWYRKAGDYIRMFFRQCFCHRIYALTFLCAGLNVASNICRNLFNVLFATKEIGMTVGVYGKILGVSSLVSMGLVAVLGKIVDRLNPMLLYFLGGVAVMAVNVFGYFFVHTTGTFAVIAVITTLVYAVQGIVFVPFLVKVFPAEKFGQFASANSMVISVFILLASYLGGKLTDRFGYRVMFTWDFTVTLLANLALIGVWLAWKKLGGKQYQPPEVD